MGIEQQLEECTQAIKVLTQSIKVLTQHIMVISGMYAKNKASHEGLENAGVLDTATGNVPEEAGPPKRKRRTKAQIEADKAQTEAAGKDDALSDFNPPQPPPALEEEYDAVSYPTIEELRAEASALTTLDKTEAKKSLKMALKIINDIGVGKISEIPEDKRTEAIQKFRQAIIEYSKKEADPLG